MIHDWKKEIFMSVSPQEFLQLAESFNEVTPEKAEELLEAGQGNIVFVGRETCPFCCQFIPRLHQVAQDQDLTINFLHSQHPDYLEAISDFREKYEVPTVPALLYSDDSTDGVKSISDSSMSEADIKSFINL